MLGMLRHIAGLRKKLGGETQLPGFPRKIMMHWSSRGESEFSLLDAQLVRICM